jgi:hypothetical protein
MGILMDLKGQIVLYKGNENRSPGCQSYYEPYFFSVVQDIHGRGVVATRLLDPEDDVPALYGLSRSL